MPLLDVGMLNQDYKDWACSMDVRNKMNI